MIAPKAYPEQTPQPEKLIEQHMPLVQRLAWHFHGRVGRFVEIEDLLQAGYLGLVDAGQRYSVREGVTFSAYAAIRIRGSIVDLLRRLSWPVSWRLLLGAPKRAAGPSLQQPCQATANLRLKLLRKGTF